MNLAWLPIDILAITIVIFCYFYNATNKKKLFASSFIFLYCVAHAVYSMSIGSKGYALFFAVAGVLNALAAYSWLGIVFPDKRIEDEQKDDS